MALEAWFRVEPSQLVRIKLGLQQNRRRNSGARRRAWRRRGACRDSAIPVRTRRQRRSDTAREKGEDHSVQAELSFFSFCSSSRHLTRASNLPSFSSFNLIPVNHLRHSQFAGLREDKDARTVIKE